MSIYNIQQFTKITTDSIILLDSVDSSNDYAKRLILGKAPLPLSLGQGRIANLSEDFARPLVILSDGQLSGKGRYGKEFFSPSSCGIYLTYATRDMLLAEDLSKLTLTSASIVHHVLAPYCKDPLDIKWINDIYLHSQKVAGILIERINDIDDPGISYLLIGIGINLCEPEQTLTIPQDIIGIYKPLFRSRPSVDVFNEIASSLILHLDNYIYMITKEKWEQSLEYYRAFCLTPENVPDRF